MITTTELKSALQSTGKDNPERIAIAIGGHYYPLVGIAGAWWEADGTLLLVPDLTTSLGTIRYEGNGEIGLRYNPAEDNWIAEIVPDEDGYVNVG